MAEKKTMIGELGIADKRADELLALVAKTRGENKNISDVIAVLAKKKLTRIELAFSAYAFGRIVEKDDSLFSALSCLLNKGK